MTKLSEFYEQWFRWARDRSEQRMDLRLIISSEDERKQWRDGYKYAMDEVAQTLNLGRMLAVEAEARQPLYAVWIECLDDCLNFEENRELKVFEDPIDAINLSVEARDKKHVTEIRLKARD